MNMAGRSLQKNKNVRPEDLIKFPDDGTKKIDKEELKRQFREDVQFHKKKFWTKIKDESLEKALGESNG